MTDNELHMQANESKKNEFMTDIFYSTKEKNINLHMVEHKYVDEAKEQVIIFQVGKKSKSN